MILRRVVKHIRNQEWTAIGIDLVIVVLGVFLGIQLGNWNEAQDEAARERFLLAELRVEIAESIEQLRIVQSAFDQVARSGERAVAFLDTEEECGDDCWNIIVDFFHASQWQQLLISRSTYDEMRRNGWPRSRAIVDVLEDYHRQNDHNNTGLEEPPTYRGLVRGLIPLAIHRPYWTTCYELTDGEERYLEDCPEVVDRDISAAGVSAIVAHPGVHAALTEWAGYISGFGATLTDQIAVGERALNLIDTELGDRS
ncbi:MAG: hypothetical protein HKN43_14770 [Rhodothermales bacterium]|nr:hypothetical protein [Rhodothermales bacterium]